MIDLQANRHQSPRSLSLRPGSDQGEAKLVRLGLHQL
jgi:hypothetical protein